MGNFNRNSNFNRGGSDRETFKAKCDDCGRDCDLPFRPTTGRPVYCRDCFKKHSPTDEGRGRDMGRGNDRSRGGDREMFDAVCANCGDKCRVPFQPRGDKEVLCSNCFEEKGGDPRKSSNNASVSQLNDIQAKLDRILEILSTKTGETAKDKLQTVKVELQTAKGQEDEMVEEITENIIAESSEGQEKPKAKKKKSSKAKKTTSEK